MTECLARPPLTLKVFVLSRRYETLSGFHPARAWHESFGFLRRILLVATTQSHYRIERRSSFHPGKEALFCNDDGVMLGPLDRNWHGSAPTFLLFG